MKNGTSQGVHHPWLKLALLATGILLVMTLVTHRRWRPSHAKRGTVVQQLRDECRSGNGKVCYALGWMHLHGRGVPQSRSRAFLYWNLSCHLKYRLSCDLTATMLD